MKKILTLLVLASFATPAISAAKETPKSKPAAKATAAVKAPAVVVKKHKKFEGTPIPTAKK
jgi:hypothetical protein